MTLRELRMWHWKRALAARANERLNEHLLTDKANWALGFSIRHKIAVSRARADMHIRAVQALNEVVPGTAEEDCNAG